jgi:hypothetical protein
LVLYIYIECIWDVEHKAVWSFKTPFVAVAQLVSQINPASSIQSLLRSLLGQRLRKELKPRRIRDGARPRLRAEFHRGVELGVEGRPTGESLAIRIARRRKAHSIRHHPRRQLPSKRRPRAGQQFEIAEDSRRLWSAQR